jgi:hypothetical protein
MLLPFCRCAGPDASARSAGFISAVLNESPFVVFDWILAATLLVLAQGDLDTPAARAGLGVVVGAPVLVRRSLRAGPPLEEALGADLGPSWRRDWVRGGAFLSNIALANGLVAGCS